MKRIVVLFSFIAIILCISGCTMIKSRTTIIEELKISSSDIKLEKGKSTDSNWVSVVYDYKDRKSFSVSEVSFHSENSSIATIQFDREAAKKYLYFKVTGINAGETYIYATSKDGSVKSNRVKVIVSPDKTELKSIKIDAENYELTLGETVKVNMHKDPESAKITNIKWTTSDSSVLTVDDQGFVKAVGGGSATISATADNNINASCSFTVDDTKSFMTVSISHKRIDDNSIGNEWTYFNKVDGVSYPKSKILSVGDTLKFEALFKESDGDPDVGEASTDYTVTEDDLKNGFAVTLDLYVTENGGSNRGKTAHFIIEYKFSI